MKMKIRTSHSHPSQDVTSIVKYKINDRMLIHDDKKRRRTLQIR